MEYKIIDKTSYKLHFIKTNRFRTTTVRVSLKNKIVKEDMTNRNVLADLLTYSTSNYNTRKKLVEKMQDLYSVSVYTKDFRVGNYNTINVMMTYLNEKYTEDGIEEECIKLLGEILFNPNVSNKKFDSDSFKFIKKNNEQSIKTIKENPARYSTIRMLQEMGKDENYSLLEFGYLEDLEKITEESIYDYYKKVLNESIVDIYIIGCFDDKLMEKYFDRYMHFETFKKGNVDVLINHSKYNKVPKIYKEQSDNNQSKLTIGCKLIDLTERERNYVLTLYNIILGSSPESRFFRNIREKYSLCYYINSSLNKLDNILLIRSGITKENFNKMMKLIDKEMQDILNGNITDSEVEDAKNIYITRLNEILDNSEAIIDSYIAVDYLNIGTIDERKEAVLSVTRDEIVKLAKKVKVDTIFLLEGDNEDE